MKKISLILILIFSIVVLISCDVDNQPDNSTVEVSTPDITTPDITTPDITTPDVTTPTYDHLIKGIIFGDVTKKADGTNISITASNVSEELEVEYKYYEITKDGNVLLETNYVVEIGNYLVIAIFTFNNEVVLTLEAELTLVDYDINYTPGI